MVLVRNLILAARTSLWPPSSTGHYQAQVRLSATARNLVRAAVPGRPVSVLYPLRSLHRPIRIPRGSGRLLFLNGVVVRGQVVYYFSTMSPLRLESAVSSSSFSCLPY